MEIQLEKPRGQLDWIALRRLYRQAFPPAERKPFRIIRSMYRQGRADVWCVRASGSLAGFAATVNGGEWVLLDYFAVRKNLRGRGIGSRALEELLQRYRDRFVFVEIESTRSGIPERTQRLRRKAFYEAAGFSPMNVTARVFGVEMELLGVGCAMDFAQYRNFYRDHYSAWAAGHILPE